MASIGTSWKPTKRLKVTVPMRRNRFRVGTITPRRRPSRCPLFLVPLVRRAADTHCIPKMIPGSASVKRKSEAKVAARYFTSQVSPARRSSARLPLPFFDVTARICSVIPSS